VERIAKSHDGWLLGSISHDETLRFWDISALSADGECRGDEEKEEDVGHEEDASGRVENDAVTVTKGKRKAVNMDMSESGSEFDSEDFSDSSESSADARSNKVRKGGRDFSPGNNGFFDGL